MGKFDKKEVCEYCEEKMNAIYRNKRFCSTKCRVYWNRANRNIQVLPTPVIIKEAPIVNNISFWQKMRNKKNGIK
jgi:predicted nucleic acid-binding Zn ribbon protein